MADNKSPTEINNYDDCDFNLTSHSDGEGPTLHTLLSLSIYMVKCSR